MKKIFILIVLTGMFSITCNLKVMGQVQVIVHASNPITSLSKKQVSDLFLKRNKKWDNGSSVKPVNLQANSSVRESFSQVIHGKSTSSINSYWQQAIFSGSGTPPPEKKSENEVIEFVKANNGAIGYVSKDFNTKGVKVLKVN